MPLTQRSFARHAGTTHRAVQKAVEAGHLAGRLDPDEPRNAAWVAQQRALRGNGAAPVVSMLALETARLETAEFEVVYREAFYLSRAELAEDLHARVETLVQALGSFAAEQGPLLAAELGIGWDRLAPGLMGAVSAFLPEVAMLHQDIEVGLANAATRWRRYPVELPDASRPRRAEFAMPGDLAECRRRLREAKNRIERIRLEACAGSRIVEPAARKLTGSIHVGLQQACLTWFPVRGPMQQVVADLGLNFVLVDQALGRAMRRILERLDRARHGDAAIDTRIAAWEERHGCVWAR
jgi:hypothetical protein